MSGKFDKDLAAQAPLKVVEGNPDAPERTREQMLAEMEAQQSEPQDDRPYYARRDDKGWYTWEGIQYPSVTTILGAAPGHFLMPWYGKQAALKAASHLVQAGIVDPHECEVLKEFCESLPDRQIDKAAAVAEVMRWQGNMREAERYRDHKARIGSIVHHAVYEHALGLRVSEGDLEDYLRHTAISLRLWYDRSRPDFEPTNEMIDSVCRSAHAYVLSAFEWIEKAQPEWEMIGQEACVISTHKPGFLIGAIDAYAAEHGHAVPDWLLDALPPHLAGQPGYAGTVDAIFTIKKDVYGQHYEWVWNGASKKLTADFKTSNSLPQTVQAQIEAYASAEFIGLVATGEKFDIPATDGIAALHIGPHASHALVEDEFGTLDSKAKVIGAKLHSWPRSRTTHEAFLGLARWFYWSQEKPIPEQRAPKTPKAERVPKTVPQKAPF